MPLPVFQITVCRDAPACNSGLRRVHLPTAPPDTKPQQFKFQFVELTIDVTFLLPKQEKGEWVYLFDKSQFEVVHK